MARRTNAAQVFQFVARETNESDYLLDVNYGGLINMLLRHPSPLYTTQFVHLTPTNSVMQKDLKLFKRHPPRLIIANPKPQLGAVWRPNAYTGCSLPELEWRLSRPTFDRSKSFPVITHILGEYKPEAYFGDIVLYGPDDKSRNLGRFPPG
jgi:hypothetical protein